MMSMGQCFIAVQCVQCSTMQVKQQKKSSNKWVCAVCNQRQSLQRVFARGPLAKDIRLFVQNSNMSRASSGIPFGSVDEEHQRHRQQNLGYSQSDRAEGTSDRKRRMDWSEYLDHAAVEEEVVDDGDLEGRFLTEIMPKVRSPKCPTKPPAKPTFTKRKQQMQPYALREDEMGDARQSLQNYNTPYEKGKCQRKTVLEMPANRSMASKWGEYLEGETRSLRQSLDNYKRPGTSCELEESHPKPVAAAMPKAIAASKWSEYLEEEMAKAVEAASPLFGDVGGVVE